MTSMLRQRLVRRSVLLAQAATFGLLSSVASAAVVESGVVNLNVVNNIDGLYLNIVTGANANATLAGWDFNPYNSAGLNFFTSTAAANVSAVTGTGTAPTAVATGGVVGPASAFVTGGVINGTGSVFRNSGTNCIGVRFTNETGTTVHYGYAVMTTTAATGFPATVNRYAWDNTPNTPITVNCSATLGSAPQFAYTPAAASTVNFTGGGAVGSTGTASIAVSVATPGAGTGAASTTTTTCTAPAAPFAGFGQTVSAEGTGAITGSPLSGTCTLGAAAATATLTCSENRGGTPTAVTFQLSCPAGTVVVVPVTSNPPSGTPVAFGNVTVGATATRTISFTNPGATAVTLTCTLTGGPFSGASGSVTVAPGATVTRTITFTSATIGAFVGNLSCTAGASQFAFGITGNAVGGGTASSIPTLGDTGRWLAILMMLGIGLVAVGVRRS